MKRVWIVDDTIPIFELYGGPFPSRLEVELVRHLVDQLPGAWAETEVRELCQALCGAEYDAAFFLSPEAMLRFLEQGAVPPHSVIFDWEYPGSDDAKNRGVLERLLCASFAYVQVYTHLGAQAIEPKLADLRAKYGPRLLPTRAKSEVTPANLAGEIRAAWAGTIAGELADKVRQEVFGAVERSLIEMCSVPRGAIAAMAQGAAENLVHVVLSKVRDEIGSPGLEVLEEIIGTPYAGESNEGLRRLLSVWYYFFPSDDRVRRGDLIEVDGELGFVITPPCDLVNFPKKAGRRLTWIRSVRLDERGFESLRSAGCDLDTVGNSIIAAHGRAGEMLVVLPNVPEDSGKRDAIADYALLCHAWESRLFPDTPAGSAAYSNFTGVRRRCTLADPFASAVVARIAGVISSPGMPDLPKGELSRLRVTTERFVKPGNVPTAGSNQPKSKRRKN